ncbi:hypothetical protein PZE02_003437 [Salmonella enterica subsp. enterica serovar Vitkin]|uniref:Uncharacterized protein n=3 Tax=Salmonella enterica TaxID=28901 RepID=A0A5Z6P4X9_SALET|nr:hypothetical protein [Salmonella enterica]EBG5369748.1 hypothetical protein [Salmonella enterica subsp. enterica serovar Monschaui]EBH8281033.1 hypothetical protein [Salmonella enterica subsp. enterica serovar Typhimurium str. UK-1]EBP3975250.1 hypothetical protein [Salmonella enterica subsp. enterica]EBS2690417.1 hypothetical protein [Salmonella enterica subsp. enterica serovar Muenchen]EBV4408309.1 hypothetical protein [Salmonella enterica subsp. enterica serovar Baildon]EBX5571767.1 hyp
MITSLTLITSASETVFFNTQRKPTKKFNFTVFRNIDGSYLVCQQAYRVYPSGHEVIKSSKLWEADNIQALRVADFMKNRQGKLFLETHISRTH